MNDFTAADENYIYWFKRHSSRELTALHNSGISIRATWHFSFMNVHLSAPAELRNSGRVRGIFGNYDGDPNNEFVTRDNPNMPITSANNDEPQQYDIYLTCKYTFSYVVRWMIQYCSFTYTSIICRGSKGRRELISHSWGNN